MIEWLVNNWGKLVAIITSLFSIGTIAYKYVRDYAKNKKDKEDYDKKEHEEIKITLKGIQEQLNIIINFIDNEKIKKEFRNKLELQSYRIITAQTVLNDSMKTLLNAGLESTIKLAEQLYFTEIPLTKDYVSDQASAVFNNLKIICNAYFPDKKLIYNKELTFARFLREHTNINNYSFEYINKIIEIKNGMYNGNRKEMMLKCFVEFIKVMYEEGISGYMEYTHGIKK